MNRTLYGTLTGLAGGMLGAPCTLVAVVAAWMFRAKVVPLDALAQHLNVVGMVVAGSVIGAWWGRRCRHLPAWLDYVLAVGLTAMACALLVQSWPGPGQHHAILLTGSWSAVLVGLTAGALFAWRSVAGAVVLVAALVLLCGFDIKVAGSLALMAGLPTLLVARPLRAVVWQRAGAMRHMVAPVAGAAVGTVLLAVLPSDILMALLAVSIQLVAMGSLLPARRVQAT